MPLTLYDVTIPSFIRAFGNLKEILKKGEAFADANGITHRELLGARLIEDMYPLTAQIQRASDTAKFVAVRVAGVENLAMADNEASFADLHARIDRTVDFLQGIDRAGFDGREDGEVLVATRNGSTRFTGKSYVLGFALPNFYFHVTTAYAILRHKGVPIGKMDYIGSVQ